MTASKTETVERPWMHAIRNHDGSWHITVWTSTITGKTETYEYDWPTLPWSRKLALARGEAEYQHQQRQARENK